MRPRAGEFLVNRKKAPAFLLRAPPAVENLPHNDLFIVISHDIRNIIITIFGNLAQSSLLSVECEPLMMRQREQTLFWGIW